MSDIKAHLKELVQTLREYLAAVPESCYAAQGEQIRATVLQLWDEIKQTLEQQHRTAALQQKLSSLRDENAAAKLRLKSAYEKLELLLRQVQQAAPHGDALPLSVWHIVHLATQFRMTQHSFPNEDIVQPSVLRTMPYTTQNRLKEPVVEPDPAAVGAEHLGVEITVTRPKSLPHIYIAGSFIQYTTDGKSVPTRFSGVRYDDGNKPRITKNMLFRAVLCHPLCLDSKMVEKLYFVDPNDSTLIRDRQIQERVRDAMERPENVVDFRAVAISETPSMASETPRPPSSNPYLLGGQSSLPYQPAGRQTSIHDTSSPDV